MINFRGILVVILSAIALTAVCRAAEPARLVVTLNCDDIRAIAQWKDWDELERRARAAGASDRQIEQARQCLSSRPTSGCSSPFSGSGCNSSIPETNSPSSVWLLAGCSCWRAGR